jgi:uncharacterized cupin superfamily protein
VIAHRDEVEEHATPWAAWRDLGRAAGSVAVGARLGRVGPGGQATPLHAHGAEEELFFVLRGGGACVTEGGEAAELREGDLVCRRSGGRAHAFVAGPDGLEFLAFGERARPHVIRLPRSGAHASGRAWWAAGEGEHPLRREAGLGPVEVPDRLTRPRWLVASGEVEPAEWGRGDVRARRADLGRAAGSVHTGLKFVRVAPGDRGVVPHCHSAEEELFYVLEGGGTFEVGEERLEVRAGHLVARPAGTGLAHSHVAGPDGLTLLAYGQRDPNDMCLYPRSGKVYLRGLKVLFHVHAVEYWDGET